MIATYLGGYSFRLQSGEVSLLIDPEGGRFKGDVVLATQSPREVETDDPSRISFPGEYEIKGIEIQGFPLAGSRDGKLLHTLFLVQWDGMRIVIAGHLADVPDADLLERAGEPDVFLVSLDGGHLSPEDARKIVKKIEPRAVIAGVTNGGAEVSKVFGQKGAPQEKFTFKQKDIAGQEGMLVLLSSKP